MLIQDSVLELVVREALQRPLERRAVRSACAPHDRHEDELVLWVSEEAVERRARDRDSAEGRGAGWWVEDSVEPEESSLPVREEDRNRRPQLQVVIVGKVLVDEGA